MIDFKSFEIWFITGSQHLYGPEILEQVAENSRQVVAGLNASGNISIEIVFKPVLTTPDAIRQLCLDAKIIEGERKASSDTASHL